MAFKAGDLIGVQCEVKPGPFAGERLVTVETVDGSISGFVSESELRSVGERWEVRGKVQEITGGIIQVMIYGSFFTTNGIANIKSDLAMAA